MKTKRIAFRVEQQQYDRIKTECRKRNISLTDAFLGAYNNDLGRDTRRKINSFIDEQGNLFVKIQTNINQFARIANTQKFVDPMELQHFNRLCTKVIDLKERQNRIFSHIHRLLARDTIKFSPNGDQNP